MVLIISVILLSGCGFRLNRNQIVLPDNARSIALQPIENRSYTPGLDILLREMLLDRFSRSGVEIQPAQTADLSLRFQIDTARYVRRDYALSSGAKTYEFLFSVSGKLTVTRKSGSTPHFNGEPITGSYSVKTESTDLTSTEITDARYEALENVADQIAGKLSQRF